MYRTYASLLMEGVTVGGYVSIFKSVVLVLILLLWSRMLTWADKDAIAAHLPRVPLNMANLGGMVVAYLAFFLLPVSFFLAILFPLAFFGAEVAVYLRMRKKVVGVGDLKTQWEAWVNSWKPKKDEKDPVYQVQLIGKNGQPAPHIKKDDHDRPIFEAVQAALTDPMRKGCDQVDMAPARDTMAVRYTVDGVSYDGATLDGVNGQGAIALIKAVAGMNLDEVRKPQTGAIKLAMIDGPKREVKLQTAGTTAGEYIRMIFDPSKRQKLTLDQLGMTPPQTTTIIDSIRENTGLVLVASPKQMGQTSLLYAIIRAHDAFLQHIQSIERDAEQAVEGMTANKMAPNEPPAEEAKKAEWVVSQEPDIIFIDRVEDPRTAATLAKFAENKRAYVGVRGGGVAEAVEQWRKACGGNDAVALDQLKLVVVGRVLRKLCSACKESYAPDPNTLRKLGMNPEKVTTLYKARETPVRDPKGVVIPCTFCQELKFKGRTGVYEVLAVDDEVRDALRRDIAAGGKIGSQFKAAFRKKGGRYLQEEALALVERGETSVQEVLRVLRGDDPAKPAASPAAATAPAEGEPVAAAARAGAKVVHVST